MIAIGVDVHKRPCTVAMPRKDGELGCFRPMENTREGYPAELNTSAGLPYWPRSFRERKWL